MANDGAIARAEVDEAACRKIARWLVASRRAVAFTGAGISTESGIPDFRSPGGVWSKSQPVYFDDFLKSAAARQEFWRQKVAAYEDFRVSKPNAGHLALARWEAAGWLRGVITQNIDELHQRAESQAVLELHGTTMSVACLDCHARYDVEEMQRRFLEAGAPPNCAACNGLLKHATISFGQPLDQNVLEQAIDWASHADFFFAIGSSLVVEPAASLPRLAKSRGARLVIINRDPTDQDPRADVVLHAPIGQALAVVDRAASDLVSPK
jgi:NAD-dependent deacetylase